MKITNDPTILHKKLEGMKEREDDEALKQVCEDFESIFLSIMFKEMQKTIPESGFVEKSTGTKIFEDMCTEEISKEIANKDNGIGIAKMLYDQFKNENIIL